MRIVAFDRDRHYGDLVRVWGKYGWLPCPAEALPRLGLVAETAGGRFIAYLGMYCEAGTIAVIDWALRDPDVPRTAWPADQDPFRVMFERLAEAARRKRCAYVYSVTANKLWGNHLVKCGMRKAETGATTYVMALAGGDTAFISE